MGIFRPRRQPYPSSPYDFHSPVSEQPTSVSFEAVGSVGPGPLVEGRSTAMPPATSAAFTALARFRWSP